MSTKLISVEDAAALLAKNPVVLDMRDESHYRNGHLPGALRLEDAVIEKLIRTGERKRTTLLYCYHGNASKDMARLLNGMGFTDIHELSGGWLAWEQAQNPSLMPDANRQLPGGMTPLMLAAASGDLREVIDLVNRGADLNAINDNGNNALWLACYGGNEDLVQYLIGKGIDLDRANDEGATALIFSASSGRPRMVKLLLDAGADPRPCTRDGFSAFDLAADRGSFQLLRAAARQAS